jgi:hypothetical protein
MRALLTGNSATTVPYVSLKPHVVYTHPAFPQCLFVTTEDHTVLFADDTTNRSGILKYDTLQDGFIVADKGSSITFVNE